MVVAPTVGYPPTSGVREYPGSVSLRIETARDLIVDICVSLAALWSEAVHVLNTGVSTLLRL